MLTKYIGTTLIFLSAVYYSKSLYADNLPITEKKPSCKVAPSISYSHLTTKRRLNTQQSYPEETHNKRITKISLKQLNVFNTNLPEENKFLFRFANDAHITTRPEVILSTLLFTEGSKYDVKELEESERLLRQQNYLYDARIYAEETCDNEVHVTVATRDLWTLLPDISFSRSGGENTSRLGFRESNLFGYGKRLSFTATENKERNGYLFVYDDPAILSSRYRGRFEFADNSDGERHYLGAYLPFYSIKTKNSYGASNFSNRRIVSLYSKGEVISEFLKETKISNVYYGYALENSKRWTKRIIVGLHHETHAFDKTPFSNLYIAENRDSTYPYIEGQWFEDKFIKVRNFDSIYRTEDLNLGWNIQTKFGYSSNSWANDHSHLVYAFSAKKAFLSNEKSLLRFISNIQGEWNTEQNKARNFISTLNLQYYFNTDPQQSWFTNLAITYTKGLTDDQQIVLGGETGLRGYPLNYQQGSRSALLNIEKRYYWEYDLLQLFKVGGAAFFDIGKVSGSTLIDTDNSVLHNVGLGLRFAPSRANAGTILHLDIAFPLNREDDIDKVQWLFTVKNRF